MALTMDLKMSEHDRKDGNKFLSMSRINASEQKKENNANKMLTKLTYYKKAR